MHNLGINDSMCPVFKPRVDKKFSKRLLDSTLYVILITSDCLSVTFVTNTEVLME